MIKCIYIQKSFIYKKTKVQITNLQTWTNRYKTFKDSKVFIKNLIDVKDVNANIEEYNANKNRNVSIAFDDMIADMLSIKKLEPIVTDILFRDK